MRRTPISKRAPAPEKSEIYQAPASLNLSFGEVLGDLNRMTQMSLFRDRFQRQSIETCRITIEETRAWINFTVTEALRGREEIDRAYFGRMRNRFEKKYEDPSDVLLRAQAIGKVIAKRSGR